MDKEHLPPAELLAEQVAGVRDLMAGAWQAAPGFVRRLEATGVAPGQLRTPFDLHRFPILRKSDLPKLQAEVGFDLFMPTGSAPELAGAGGERHAAARMLRAGGLQIVGAGGGGRSKGAPATQHADARPGSDAASHPPQGSFSPAIHRSTVW